MELAGVLPLVELHLSSVCCVHLRRSDFHLSIKQITNYLVSQNWTPAWTGQYQELEEWSVGLLPFRRKCLFESSQWTISRGRNQRSRNLEICFVWKADRGRKDSPLPAMKVMKSSPRAFWCLLFFVESFTTGCLCEEARVHILSSHSYELLLFHNRGPDLSLLKGKVADLLKSLRLGLKK